MNHPTTTLDLRRTGSPMLPLLVRRALAQLAPGHRLEVLVGSQQWARDLRLILRRAGDRCLACQARPDHWRLLVVRGHPSQPPPE